jgi:hypothetical protein
MTDRSHLKALLMIDGDGIGHAASPSVNPEAFARQKSSQNK